MKYLFTIFCLIVLEYVPSPSFEERWQPVYSIALDKHVKKAMDTPSFCSWQMPCRVI